MGRPLSRLLSSTPVWAWITAGIALLAAVVVGFFLTEGGSGSASAQDSLYAQHPEDVKIVSCGEQGGYAAAALRVTNNSQDESTYAIQIAFEAPQARVVYDSRTVIVAQLPAHQASALARVRSSKPVGKQRVSCVVVGAARYGT